jgi:hypothetical protein
MGVEEIQRVNALAKELMKHGMAGTSDEALLRAEDMLRGNGVNSMTAAITSSGSMGKTEATHLSNEALQEFNMGIRQLGVRFDSIAKEVLGMKEEIKKLNSTIGDMERQINRMSALQQSVPVERHDAVQSSMTAQPAPAQTQYFARESVAPMQAAVAPAQPQFVARVAQTSRAGKEEFKPEDVAIEKIFYFGK